MNKENLKNLLGELDGIDATIKKAAEAVANQGKK